MTEPAGSRTHRRSARRRPVPLGRLWHRARWPLIAALALAAFVLGFVGFDAYHSARGTGLRFWDTLYVTLQLFSAESGALPPPVPAALEVARFLAPAVTLSAAAAAILALFNEQVRRTRARWFPRDVIVCGLGDAGYLLARGFRDRGSSVVAIERDGQNPKIGPARDAGVLVLVGDAAERTMLENARVDRARYLVAVCGDDGLNAGIAIQALDLQSPRRPHALHAFVRMLDPGLAELLEMEMAARSRDVVRFEFFNPAERGAAAILNEHPAFDDRAGAEAEHAHPLVIGLGEMGSRLVVHLAARWRARVTEHPARLRVTVADREAGSLVERLHARHPHLREVCDVVARTIDVDTPEFERGDFLFDPDVTSVYVCLDDDALGLSAALRVRHLLRSRTVPVVVRTTRHGGLGTLVGEVGHENIRVFGLLDLVCRPEVLLESRSERLARAIHEDYVRAQRRDGATPAENASVAPWDEVPDHVRESNRRQGDDIGAKLREIGCEIDWLGGSAQDRFEFGPEEIERLARREHDRWWREREADGWTLAPEKDGERKKSPYLVPWEHLAEEVRELDRNAVRAIPALLARVGYRIVRPGNGDGTAE